MTPQSTPNEVRHFCHPLTLKSLVSLTLMLLLQANLQASVEDKVATDVVLYQAYEATTEAINQGSLGPFVTLGGDVNCDHLAPLVSIQDLIDAGATEIRIASNASYNENLISHDRDLILRGGFVDCSAAANNTQDLTLITEINGGSMDAPVLRITGGEDRHLLRLEHLNLVMGTSSNSLGFGGGLSVDEVPVDIQLKRMVFADNRGSIGSGVLVDSGVGSGVVNITLFGEDVLILQNESLSLGAGLHCIGRAQIALTGMSLIFGNQALAGSGLYMRNGCEVGIYPHLSESPLTIFSGLVGNESSQDGGGAYIDTGSELYLFGQTMCHEGTCLGSDDIPVVLFQNAADNDENGSGSGGGVYMAESSFNSEFYASGLYATENITPGSGGAFYQGDNTTLTIERRAGACWDDLGCNTLENNQSLGEGGAFFMAGGQLAVSQAFMHQNRSNNATVIAVRGSETSAVIQNSVLFNNGDNGSGMFNDQRAVLVDDGASLTMVHNTLVDNPIINPLIEVGSAAGTEFTLQASLVHDIEDRKILFPTTGTVNIDCLLTHEDSFTGQRVVVDTPLFVDRLGGDLRQQPGSPGIDLCPQFTVNPAHDIQGEIREWDDPTQINLHGSFDAGADEGLLSDVIFANGLEPEPL